MNSDQNADTVMAISGNKKTLCILVFKSLQNLGANFLWINRVIQTSTDSQLSFDKTHPYKQSEMKF